MECIRYISLANGMTFPTSTEQESFYAELIHADDNSAMENAALLAAKVVYNFADPETQAERSELMSKKDLAEETTGTISIQEENVYVEVDVPASIYNELAKITFFKLPDQVTVYQMKHMMTDSERQQKYTEVDPGEDGTVIEAYPQWFTGKSKVNTTSGSVNSYRVGLFGEIPTATTTITMYSETPREAGSALLSESSIAEGQTLNDAIAATDATSIRLMSGTYAGELTLDSSIKVVGSNDESQKDIETVSGDETIINGLVTVSGKGTEVELRGVTLTGDALIRTEGASSIKLVNCRINGLTSSDAKPMLIQPKDSDVPLKVTIENCRFGANTNAYHVFDNYAKLANGSSISNNYFEAEACVHNIISIYNVAEGATINVNNNHAESSKNMIRVGVKGDVKWTLACNNNSYDETEAGSYAGMILIQPYGKETTSFANCTIIMNNTTKPEGSEQLYYIYCGANDTVLTPATYPKIYVDNILQTPVSQYESTAPVCANGATPYSSLTDAIAAVKPGATKIDLLADATIDTLTLNPGTSVTIEGYGAQRTITGRVVLGSDAAGDVSLNLANVVLEGGGTNTFGIIAQNQSEEIPNNSKISLSNVVIQNFTSKGMYLTNVKELKLKNVTLTDVATDEMNDPNTRGDYGIDLNLIGVKDVVVSLDGVSFNGDCGKKAAVKITQRGGASDADASDIPKTVGEATVKSVDIKKCAFNNTEAAASFNVGSSSKTEGAVENTTGRYPVTISENTTTMTVCFPFVSDSTIFTVEAGKTATKSERGDALIVE